MTKRSAASIAARILAADRPFRDVSVPDWGLTVRVQSLSGRERMEMFDIILSNESECADAVKAGEKPKRLDQMIIQLIFAARDPETGDRVFTIDQHDDLLEVSYQALEALYAAFVELNMRAIAAQSVEELTKSSD